MAQAIYRYHFVLNDTEELNLESESTETSKILIEILSDISKKYVFQLERGKQTQRLHFQGRFSLITKKRKVETLKMFKRLATISLIPETKDGEEASSFYCMKKDDTYVEGPWSNETEKEVYIPINIRELEALRPWQTKIIDLAKVMRDYRTINVVYDTQGNVGKTTICTYMGVYGIGKLLPFCNDYKDILRMCYDIGPKKAYLIDMPRAISKERLFQFYAAIETIKSGYAYDDRYNFRDRYFDPPNIFVFTNVLPDETLLSQDRWVYWQVVDEVLLPYKRQLDSTVSQALAL